jgi:hypothetical protein
MRYNGFWILTLAVLLAVSVVPARANLITDPGFESCTVNGGTLPGWTASLDGACNSLAAHTGNWGALFSGHPNTLSQTITTIVGDNYDFSFWLTSDLANSPSFLTASFGGDEVLDLVDPGVFDYTLEDFTVTATGTSTTIEFGGENGDISGGWALDDVSVTDQGPSAPEPASLVLLGSGLLAIAWRFRRHRRAPEQVTIFPYAQSARRSPRNPGKR